jgi:hypothetical protein
MLKLTQQEFTGLPQHLQLELLIGTALCLIGEKQPCTQHNLLPATCCKQQTSCLSWCTLLLLHAGLASLLCAVDSIGDAALTSVHRRFLACMCAYAAGGFIISGSVKPIVISRGAP